MEDSIIKEALSYSLGSDLHEAWRAPRKKDDGTFEPRIKTSKDEEWNIKHGTNQVDIANCSFSELPFNWQYENLEAARVVINLVYDKIISGKKIEDDELEKMGSIIHEEWLKRNTWVYDPVNGNPELAVPYEKLSNEEKMKDIAQIEPAILKVQAYINGLINIEDICEQYNIEINKRLSR